MNSSALKQPPLLFRIVAPRFVAGGYAQDGVITLAAPIIHYLVGWTIAQVQQYLADKKWKLKWLPDESQVDE